jgi:Cu/Ag efflux pump CusA
VFAHGAAALSRRGVGTAVFGGMIAATTLGIFLIPMLYVTFQSGREWVKARFKRQPDDARAHAPAGDD